MHFFCHKMLVGVCGRTKKHFTSPFLAFCANSEVNFTPKIGSKMAKFKVFGHFETLISKIMVFKQVTCILLIKIQLLVPNLCLQDLLCRFYGQKSEKKNESIQKSGSGQSTYGPFYHTSMLLQQQLVLPTCSRKFRGHFGTSTIVLNACIPKIQPNLSAGRRKNGFFSKIVQNTSFWPLNL